MDRSHDYRFFPFEPECDWTSDPLSPLCMVERPTLILRRNEDRVVVRATGIPSARIDAVGTAVRYSVALDAKTSKAALGEVRAFVEAWLQPDTREKLGVSLDAHDLDEWFTSPPSLSETREMLGGATKHAGARPAVGRTTEAPLGVEVGGFDRAENVASLRAWVTRLLEKESEPGFAAVVNLADGSRDFEVFRQTSQSGLVLMMEDSSRLRRLESALTDSDKGGATAGKASGAYLPLACAMGLLLALLLWIMVR